MDAIDVAVWVDWSWALESLPIAPRIVKRWGAARYTVKDHATGPDRFPRAFVSGRVGAVDAEADAFYGG